MEGGVIPACRPADSYTMQYLLLKVFSNKIIIWLLKTYRVVSTYVAYGKVKAYRAAQFYVDKFSGKPENVADPLRFHFLL